MNIQFPQLRLLCRPLLCIGLAFPTFGDSAELQRLAAPIPLEAGGRPIRVDGNAAPFVGDVDEDGRKDLLVGQFDLGRLRVYRNQGTPKQPEYADFEWLRTDSGIAAVPTGCNIGFVPHLVDFNGDGRTDLLSGSFRGEVFLFRRHPDGGFYDAEVLQNKAGSVWMRRIFPKGNTSRYNSTAHAVDWDSDGDMDLLLGRSAYCWVRNEGTSASPKFGDAQPIVIDGECLVNGRVGPCTADWDVDGRVDLIIGRGDEIVWYRNLDNDEQQHPVFAEAEVLLAQGNQTRSGPTLPDTPAGFCAFCVADLTGDGRPDLIVGDEFRQRVEPIPASNDEEKRKSLALLGQRDLFREYRDLCVEPKSETPSERIERFRQMIGTWQQYSALKKLEARQRHIGRVWLYRRIKM